MNQKNVTPAGGNVSHAENMKMMKGYIQKKQQEAISKLKKAG